MFGKHAGVTNFSSFAGVEAETLVACKAKLNRLGIQTDDVLATLLFGSKGKGCPKSGSDIDLIFFLPDEPAYPNFLYEREELGGARVDFNVVKPSALGELCRHHVGWAYRLHRGTFIPAMTKIPQSLLAIWMARIAGLIESNLACRARLIRHVRDCRALVKGARALANSEPSLARYLMVEAAFSVPLIHLNRSQVVPFQDGNPWNEALRVTSGSAEEASYQDIVAAVNRSRLFATLDRYGQFADELKSVRDRCRMIVVRHLGNAFADGYGSRLTSALTYYPKARGELTAVLGSEPFDDQALLDAVADWVEGVRVRQTAAALPRDRRTVVSRIKTKLDGIRHVHYDAATARLKAIVPTGGCRVPTCTFCMLPQLARAKSSVDGIVASIREAGRAPVRQLTVYTDGSFFDERELTRGEQLLIAQTARDLGAAELLVESLPRFAIPKAVVEVQHALGPATSLRIGVGVQSTHASVRQYITGTPISQAELQSMLAWHGEARVALRLYLLANKPLMSASEDIEDVERSLVFLVPWLMPQDIVTVNPLLPTRGTLVEKIAEAGCWRPLGGSEMAALAARLTSKAYPFKLEVGPTTEATCTDQALNADHSSDNTATGTGSREQNVSFAETLTLPWSILGGLRHRSHWAKHGGLVEAVARFETERVR